jgi:hypothetical protein
VKKETMTGAIVIEGVTLAKKPTNIPNKDFAS